MESTYHILNGDALLEQLPDSIEGERLVCRECLVDGDVQGDTLEELYATRAKFIGTHYPGETEEGYYAEAVPELNKIAAIPAGSNVYLWFEDDLFCQVNLWFVASMLPDEVEVFLVRPEGDLHYGFSGMEAPVLEQACQQALRLTNTEVFAMSTLWIDYQHGRHKVMMATAREFDQRLPFLMPAIEAEQARHGKNGAPGLPEQVLRVAMAELGSDQFGPVFQRFWERLPIYGFGDLQVKRLFDQIKA